MSAIKLIKFDLKNFSCLLSNLCTILLQKQWSCWNMHQLDECSWGGLNAIDQNNEISFLHNSLTKESTESRLEHLSALMPF